MSHDVWVITYVSSMYAFFVRFFSNFSLMHQFSKLHALMPLMKKCSKIPKKVRTLMTINAPILKITCINEKILKKSQKMRTLMSINARKSAAFGPLRSPIRALSLHYIAYNLYAIIGYSLDMNIIFVIIM